jgi:hypothetical protein
MILFLKRIHFVTMFNQIHIGKSFVEMLNNDPLRPILHISHLLNLC